MGGRHHAAVLATWQAAVKLARAERGPIDKAAALRIAEKALNEAWFRLGAPKSPPDEVRTDAEQAEFIVRWRALDAEMSAIAKDNTAQMWLRGPLVQACLIPGVNYWWTFL